MKLLLDENVPLPLLSPLRHLLPAHDVDHVERIGWKGKKDRFLLPDASARGYDGLLTKDSAQLDSPDESRAIRDSGMLTSGSGRTASAAWMGWQEPWPLWWQRFGSSWQISTAVPVSGW